MRKIISFCLIIFIFTVSLSGCNFLKDFANDYNIHSDTSSTEIEDYENNDIGSEKNNGSQQEFTQEDNEEKSIFEEDKVQGFSFKYKGEKLDLTMKCKSFMDMVGATTDADLTKVINWQTPEKIKIKIDNYDYTITIINLNCEKDMKIEECTVLNFEGAAQENITFEQGINSSSKMEDVVKVYGKSDFTNAGLEEKFLYYRLQDCDFNEYNIGIEFIFDLDGNMKSFKYGETNPNYLQYIGVIS